MTTIIDTHTHVVSRDRDRFPLKPGVAGSPWYVDMPKDAADLLAEMDGAGVHGAILVQAHGPYAFDNAYCAAARDVAPARFASVSIIDMTGADPIGELTHWATEGGMGGTRIFHLPPPPEPWLDDPATKPVWDRAVELGLRINVCIAKRDLPRLARALEWAPPVPVSLDHCGLIEMVGVDGGKDLGPLLDLARFEQVHLKVSSYVLDWADDLGETPAGLVRHLADHFGAHRLMWGSDWPQTHNRTYPELVGRGVDAADRLDGAERDRYLGGTALALWPELTPGR